MPFMLSRIHVDDYDAWKSMFDSDPAGARQAAKGHQVLRGLDDPPLSRMELRLDAVP